MNVNLRYNQGHKEQSHLLRCFSRPLDAAVPEGSHQVPEHDRQDPGDLADRHARLAVGSRRRHLRQGSSGEARAHLFQMLPQHVLM